jgi:hypothetical protein
MISKNKLFAHGLGGERTMSGVSLTNRARKKSDEPELSRQSVSNFSVQDCKY